MRFVWSAAVYASALSGYAFALSGCVDETSGPTACEVGPDIYQDALRGLRESEPVCTADDQCLSFPYKFSCEGYSVDICGAPMHRAAAERWNPGEVCALIKQASTPSDLGCETQASCINPGVPVCRAGKCVRSWTGS